MHLVENEFKYRLFYQRSVDVLIICCVYGVTRYQEHTKKAVSMKGLVDIHTKMPHFQPTEDVR